MAAVPTFVYLGDLQVNGGASTSRAPTEGAAVAGFTGGLVGIYRNWARFSRSIPWNPATGLPPGSPAFFPYWDGYRAVAWGTASSATGTTMSVAGTPWTPSAFVGFDVYIVSGTGSGQTRTISANTNNQITVPTWSVTPDATSKFEIRDEGWVVYHHTNGLSPNMPVPVVAGAHGDNWYEFGGAITPNTMLMQLLAERYTATPYFRQFKQAFDGGIGVGNAPLKTTAWAAFEAEWGRAVTKTAAEGNTLDVKMVVLDASYTDIALVNLNYAADLQLVIDNVRTKFGAGPLIVVVNHHKDMMGVSLPAASPFGRDANRTVAAANANVVLLDMSYATFAPEVPLAPVVAENRWYTTEDYIQAGVRLYGLFDAWMTGAPSATAGSGIAVVALIADSQGNTMNPLLAVLGGQASILGPDTATTVRANQWIWNAQTRQVELYNVDANASTAPALLDTFGFEATVLKRLAETHPSGVVVFKYAKNGAALTTEAVASGAQGAFESAAGTLLPEVIAEWNDCRQAILTQLGRTADCIGIGVAVGDNDTFSAAAGAAFGAKAQTFVDDLRDIFTTRSSGTLPVVWLQPPKHLTLGGTSSHGSASPREAVRAGVLDLAALPRVRVLVHDSKRYELQRSDRIHYGGEATFAIGYDFVDSILAIEQGIVSLVGSPGGPIEMDPAADPSPSSVLQAIDDAIANNTDVGAYTVNGRFVQMRSMGELIAARKYFEAQKARQSGLRRTRMRFDA